MMFIGTSVKQATECFVYWKDSKTRQFWGLNFINAVDARRFKDFCTVCFVHDVRVRVE